MPISERIFNNFNWRKISIFFGGYGQANAKSLKKNSCFKKLYGIFEVYRILYLPLFLFSNFIYASDPLDGTTWKTIDDKTKQPSAIVKFSEDKQGKLTATIQQVLVANEEKKCISCEGKYKNHSLAGLIIVRDLKKIKENEYDNGKILDPANGQVYSFNAKLSADGKKLTGRGFIGISLVGRNQTWYRIN